MKLVRYSLLFFFLLFFIFWGTRYITVKEYYGDIWSHIQEDVFIDDINQNLMLGSSSIKKLYSEKFLPCGAWLNRGIGGATIEHISTYASMPFAKIYPKHILLYSAENDIALGIPIVQIEQELTNLVQALREKYSSSKIHLIAIKPAPKRKEFHFLFSQMNKKIDTLANKHTNVFFHKPARPFKASDFQADGIHLSDTGYLNFIGNFQTHACN